MGTECSSTFVVHRHPECLWISQEEGFV